MCAVRYWSARIISPREQELLLETGAGNPNPPAVYGAWGLDPTRRLTVLSLSLSHCQTDPGVACHNFKLQKSLRVSSQRAIVVLLSIKTAALG